MTRVVPQSAEDLMVALGYGQFSLSTDVEPDSSDILNEAFEGRGIAQRRGTTVVLSRHQNNFAMPPRVEVGGPADHRQRARTVRNTAGYPASYTLTHSSGLFDVTSGSNGTFTPSIWCHAGTGWDRPTGLGTPNGTSAF